jgi:hypothetical protein
MSRVCLAGDGYNIGKLRQSRRVIHNRRNRPSTMACVPYPGPTLGDASDRFERERDALAASITHVNSNYGDALSLKPALILAATFGFIHHEYIRI